MRISHFTAIAFSIVTTVAASAAEPLFLDYPAAVAAAKSSRKDILVLVDGPGWAPDSAEVRKVFVSSGVRSRFGDKVVWSLIEQSDTGEAPEKKPGKPVEPEVNPWNLPALLVIDPDGRVGAVAEGVRAKTASGILSRAASLIDTRKKRDDIWKRARAATGSQRAQLFGSGLDLMPLDRAMERKDIIDEIRKADAKDATGYLAKYTFDPGAFHEKQVDPLIRAKKYDELTKLLDGYLANPRLLPRQRQVVMAGYFQMFRAREDMKGALESLRRIAAFDARNDMGVGAQRYRKYLLEPVKIDGLRWASYDNRPVWLPMIFDVSSLVKDAGTYEVEFAHRSGNTRFGKVALMSGGAEIGSDENKGHKRKVRVTVAKPRGKVELHAVSQGTGWFDGQGDVIVRKVD